jgi:hypothetical protein
VKPAVLHTIIEAYQHHHDLPSFTRAVHAIAPELSVTPDAVWSWIGGRRAIRKPVQDNLEVIRKSVIPRKGKP